MLRLYFVPGRSWLPRWLLDEIGADYELVELDMQKGELKTPDFLLVNPLGKAPALETDSQVMTETAAICLYLAHRFAGAGFGPPHGQKPRYLTLMVHASAALEPALADRLFKREQPTETVGWGTLDDELAFVEGHLGKGPYLFGERFTAADVMIGGVLIWGQLAGVPITPPLMAYTDRLMARPALARLFEAFTPPSPPPE